MPDIYTQDFFICPLWWKTLVFLSLERKYFWLLKNPLYCMPKNHHIIEYDWSSARSWIAERTACRHVSRFLLVKHFTQNNFSQGVLKLHSKVVEKKSDAYINYKANNLIKTTAQICPPTSLQSQIYTQLTMVCFGVSLLHFLARKFTVTTLTSGEADSFFWMGSCLFNRDKAKTPILDTYSFSSLLNFAWQHYYCSHPHPPVQ